MLLRNDYTVAMRMALSKAINQQQEFQHEKKRSIICRHGAQRTSFRR